jgi:ABC-type Fe3+ transport system substrate-binding protein
MTVIKRDRQSSAKDLVTATEKFAQLLNDQGESEASEFLKGVAKQLGSNSIDTQRSAGLSIIDAFEGDLELGSFVINKPNPNEWTEADELSQAATRVLNLARRLRA